jgi:hypothetical protein
VVETFHPAFSRKAGKAAGWLKNEKPGGANAGRKGKSGDMRIISRNVSGNKLSRTLVPLA